jgi:Acetamidase/Formamidase family
MVKGDPGLESIYLWTKEKKGVNRRGAGAVDGKLLGRGAGEGLGVHICIGPVYIRGAEPGDIVEVRIMDVKPRPCANPAYGGGNRSAATRQRGGASITAIYLPRRSRAKSARSTK